MTTIRAELATFIAEADRGNKLSPYQLACDVANHLVDLGLVTPTTAREVEDFADAANRGAGYLHPKPLGPDALADAVITEFGLDWVA